MKKAGIVKTGKCQRESCKKSNGFTKALQLLFNRSKMQWKLAENIKVLRSEYYKISGLS